MGYILLGVWMFVLYCALYNKINDVEKKIDIYQDENEEDEY